MNQEEKNELIKKGFIEKSDMPYMDIGDYTEMHYYNAEGERVTEENSTMCLFNVFKNDGTFINQTVGYKTNSNNVR